MKRELLERTRRANVFYVRTLIGSGRAESLGDGVGPGETRVGLAVLGGIFGEAIELVGERLIGAVIVGVGLPSCASNAI